VREEKPLYPAGEGNFDHLRQLFSAEEDSDVKTAHKLNYKVLYPSNLERYGFL
jgi:hypothetical protein